MKPVNRPSVQFTVRIIIAGLAITLAPLASHAYSLENAVYDSITGVTNQVNGAFGNTNGTPRTFMGDIFNLSNPFPGPVTITSLDLGFAYTSDTPTPLLALNANLKFYETTSDVPGQNILQNPVTNVLTFDIRQSIVNASNALNGTNFTVDNFVLSKNNYIYHIDLSTPFLFNDVNINGIAVNYTGDTGSGLSSSDTLTSTLRVGPAPARGTRGLNLSSTGGGFLRNVSGRTDFNFNQTDARTITIGPVGNTFSGNSGLAMRLYTNVTVVPEANTLGLIALGIGVPLASLIRRRRK